MIQSSPARSPETAQWESLGKLEDFEVGALKTVKRPPHQLVVARTEDGEVYALDNRCPHEGYPLASGDLKGCALTCGWHNWKFDVRDGSCTLGGEGVRSFATKVEDGELLCDLSEPDPEAFFPAWKASFEEGMFKHENDRAIRDGVRLLSGGYPAWNLLADIATYDANHAEYGCGHALAVSADVGRILERYPDSSAMYAIAPAVDMCGDSNRRLPRRKRPEPVSGATLEELRRAVETEDVERAEALILGAFDEGVERVTIDEWMFTAMSDHFLSFGHPLIYQIKLQELMEHVDESYARDIYGSLIARTGYSTREDTLPYMSAYANFVKEIEGELAHVWTLAKDDAPYDHAAVRAAVLDGRAREACEVVWKALKDGVRPERIAETLVGCAAERLNRFDVAIDTNPDVAENWVWVTHRLTFASAVRNAIERFRSPDALRFLFQTVMFTHSGRTMDEPEEARHVPSPRPDVTVESVLGAIRSKDAKGAADLVLGYLRAGTDLSPLKEALEDLTLADPLVRPIVVTHAIKTSFVAFEEYAALTDGRDRETCLLSVVRLLASPIAERRVKQTVRTSIAWVDEGEIPRKLTQ